MAEDEDAYGRKFTTLGLAIQGRRDKCERARCETHCAHHFASMVLVINQRTVMSAKQIPIEFPTSTATEHGDGVLIHWTTQHDPNKRIRAVCASIETTYTVKRMEKYLREDGRP